MQIPEYEKLLSIQLQYASQLERAVQQLQKENAELKKQLAPAQVPDGQQAKE
jgi:hypothetical protein